jgi:uncharacterized membrane protein
MQGRSMNERFKTALAGGVAGLIIAVFIFFFFRDPEAGFTSNVLLLVLAPVGGFAGGWLGYKRDKN